METIVVVVIILALAWANSANERRAADRIRADLDKVLGRDT